VHLKISAVIDMRVIGPVNSEFDRECLLVLRAATSTGFFSKYAVIQKTLTKLHSFSAKGRDRVIWLANGKVGAFADWSRDVLAFLFVDPTFQRMGVGKSLISWRLKSGVHTLQTLCVKENAAALSFYLSQSFRIVGERRGRLWGQQFENYVLSISG
jgi:ribosomal protein S18 acetylase RimI-like enzyme